MKTWYGQLHIISEKAEKGKPAEGFGKEKREILFKSGRKSKEFTRFCEFALDESYIKRLQYNKSQGGSYVIGRNIID